MARIQDPNFNCESCGAPLSNLLVGGVGANQRTITCRKCLHIKKNIPLPTINYLVATQYNISVEAASLADETSQQEYEQIALGGQPFPDLPPVTTVARYTLRRRRAAE